MAYSVGPKQGGMAPQGFMMGGMRQGATIRRKNFEDENGVVDEAAYKKALAAEAANEKRFFDGVDRDRQASTPWWVR